jgi:hypothetical protein
MESSSPSAELTALQRDVLRTFFDRERGFFLTGGGALVGFHLHHRLTDDLDLFTLDPAAFERGTHVIRDVGVRLDARVEVRQDAPGFRRYALERTDGTLIVDLVLDRVPQVNPRKLEKDGILYDSVDEILANKLTALVGRAEERDLVDVYFIEQHGYRVENALAAALRKDGGCTPATVAWALSQWEIPDGASLPAQVEPALLRTFLADLIVRLRRAAAPV